MTIIDGMPSRRLAWDCSGLLHAARADRLDVLGEHARGPRGQNWENVTTTFVEHELRSQGVAVPSWIRVLPDDLDDQVNLPRWLERVSAGRRNVGEATVLNAAEIHSMTAIIDDADARRVAERYRVEVHGVLWVICQQVTSGTCTVGNARGLVDQLHATGARFPFPRGAFEPWARENGLL